MQVPDLFRTLGDRAYAEHLYTLAIVTVADQRVAVELCRRVRKYAKQDGASDRLLGTCFSWELDALLSLQRPDLAHALIDRYQREARARGVDLNRDVEWLDCYLAPVLYERRRFEKARVLREGALELAMQSRQCTHLDLLFRIYNTDRPPANRMRVTLWHIYEGLGRSLRAWQGWPHFVDSFNETILETAGLDRASLGERPTELHRLYHTVMSVRTQRITSGVSRGELDLTQSGTVVSAEQRKISQGIQDFKRRTAPQVANVNADLHRFFPFLA